MDRENRTAQRTISRIASRQHGVATRTQLLRAGISQDQVAKRVRSGALIRVHRGVYRVGHRAPSVDATYIAAVLACGDGALLGDHAAGHLLRLMRTGPAQPSVIAPTERRVAGVRTRRARRTDLELDRAMWRGIPVTSVARTIVDLAADLSLDALARACHEAGIHHGTTPDEIAVVVERHPNATGRRKLIRVIEGDVHVSLSVLETRFLRLLRRERFPLPQTNHPAGGRFVDCRWPEHRLTVELDSYRFHSSRHAWERDRRREREAYARGDQFRRYTYADVCEDPRAMLAELVTLFPRLS